MRRLAPARKNMRRDSAVAQCIHAENPTSVGIGFLRHRPLSAGTEHTAPGRMRGATNSTAFLVTNNEVEAP